MNLRALLRCFGRVPSLLCGAGLLAGTPAFADADAPASEPPSAAALVEHLGLVEAPAPVRERAGWAPPKAILVNPLVPELADALRASAPQAKFLVAATPEEAAKLAKDADVSLGWCTPAVLAAGKKLKWIQAYAAGVERCVGIPELRQRDILLTNMQRVAAPVMAEHVLAMMLAFSRGLQFFIPEHAAGRWTEEPPPTVKMLTLEGKTLLVVGLGGIGTEVARRAHALGMKVTAVRNTGHEGPDYVSYVGLPAELRQLAGAADFVVNTTPLTAATTHLFDAKFFASCKRGAYFFNVGRGKSVVQEDLVAALMSGQIAGAGLDVTDPEPLPADDPLWKLPNVILTPHVAVESDLGYTVRFAVLKENLRRYVAGEKMLSVVDVAKGY
jgi:phosphoglycerate dehydrogenase-like enzyme